MVGSCDVYIITKDAGTLLTKFSLLGEDENGRDELVSGFLTALNSFSKEIGSHCYQN